MEVTSEIIREILKLTKEEYEKRKSKGHYKRCPGVADRVYEEIQKKSKKIFGIHFSDIQDVRLKGNLKKDIQKVLNGQSDSLMLCSSVKRKRKSKYLIILVYYLLTYLYFCRLIVSNLNI